jgi:hypothetical protein
MCCDTSSGGMNAVDIQLKLTAFRIRHIVDLLYREDAPRWKAFAIYYIGFHLRRWRASFASNLIPHSSQIPPYYATALQEFKDFVARFPNVSLEALQAREVYSLLLASRGVTPSICGQQENGLVDFDACWRNVHSAFLCPKLRDLNWRMAHDILPLNAKLHRHNRTMSDRCSLCERHVENQLHLFTL